MSVASFWGRGINMLFFYINFFLIMIAKICTAESYFSDAFSVLGILISLLIKFAFF